MGKMVVEKRFVGRYVFQRTQSLTRCHVQHPVNQEKWVAVREDFPNTVYVYFVIFDFHT